MKSPNGPRASLAAHALSLSLALALPALAAGCDTEPTKSVFADGGVSFDKGGSMKPPVTSGGTPSNGTPNNGTPHGTNNGGTNNGGTNNNTNNGNNNGAPAAQGDALVKFCNSLVGQNGPIELELRVGSQSFRASSGQCSPGSGQACTAIRAGKQAVALLYNGTAIWNDTVDIQPGVNVVAETGLDSNDQPLVAAKPLASPAACTAAGLTATGMQMMPTPNPQPGTGQMAPAKFCHDLTKGGQAIDLELVIGTARLRARSGSCSTAPAASCQGIPVGSHTATLLEGGAAIATATVEITAGEEYIFFPELQNMTPALSGGSLKAGFTCAAFDPFTSGN